MVAFDPCFMRKSGSAPRYISLSDIFSENFSAGVDLMVLFQQ